MAAEGAVRQRMRVVQQNMEVEVEEILVAIRVSDLLRMRVLRCTALEEAVAEALSLAAALRASPEAPVELVIALVPEAEEQEGLQRGVSDKTVLERERVFCAALEAAVEAVIPGQELEALEAMVVSPVVERVVVELDYQVPAALAVPVAAVDVL